MKKDNQFYLKNIIEGKKEIKVDSSNCIQVFQEIIKNQLTSHSVYRGLTIDEQIFPTILRFFEKLLTICKIGQLELFSNFQNYEWMTLKDYDKYSIQYLPYYDSCIDWLASAQHFGLPTRLVDWTFDPLVAIFFAINNFSLNEDSIVLSTSYLPLTNADAWLKDNLTSETSRRTPFNNNAIIKKLPVIDFGFSDEQFENKRLKHLVNLFDELDISTEMQFKSITQSHIYFESYSAKYLYALRENDSLYNENSMIFVDTNNANPRIIAQKGLFQIAQFPQNKFETIESIKSYLVEVLKSKVSSYYRIKKEDKIEILKVLKKLNVFKPRLFPDLQNICDYIKYNTLSEGKIDE